MFQCRTRLCWWCKKKMIDTSKAYTEFQCRTRLCWWCKLTTPIVRQICIVSMPHAALLVVQAKIAIGKLIVMLVSMPHAALLVVQEQIAAKKKEAEVSMPHAALLVVQEGNRI